MTQRRAIKHPRGSAVDIIVLLYLYIKPTDKQNLNIQKNHPHKSHACTEAGR